MFSPAGNVLFDAVPNNYKNNIWFGDDINFSTWGISSHVLTRKYAESG